MLIKTFTVIFFLCLLIKKSDNRSVGNLNSYSTRSNSESEKRESAIDDKLKTMEHRLTKFFDERLQRVNQSLLIAYIEKVLLHVTEDLYNNVDVTRRHEKELSRLRHNVTNQQDMIANLRLLTKALCPTLTNASIVESVQEERVEHSTTSILSPTTSKPTDTHNGLPTDCAEVSLAERHEASLKTSLLQLPLYYSAIVQPDISKEPFRVYCYIPYNQTAWTVIQRRLDGSVNFRRLWKEYKEGFGRLDGEFWLGNDKIHQLTNQGYYSLRIEMQDFDGTSYWAEYRNFRISNEIDKYRLYVSGYSGDAGDSLSSRLENSHNGQPFSTADRDNDRRYYDNCAEHYGGGWWYNSCFQSNLNGIYYNEGEHEDFFRRNGIQWNTIHLHASLRSAVMMIRRRHGENFEEMNNGIHWNGK